MISSAIYIKKRYVFFLPLEFSNFFWTATLFRI